MAASTGRDGARESGAPAGGRLALLRSSLKSTALVLVAALCWSPAAAQTASAQAGDSGPVFVTLGTQGGPIPDPSRSQPANVLLIGADAVMIDVGDGAVERLAAAGVALSQVHTVFLSHLHLDHTAGLQGLIGLRWMTNTPGVLTIYGPAGTRALVSGLIASMAPADAVGFGLPGGVMPDPAKGVRVIEIGDNATMKLGWGSVRAVANTHYSFPPDRPPALSQGSLSYRFEIGGRSLVYTGDTGVSPKVAALAKNADMLVSEVIDLAYFRAHPPVPASAPAALREGVMRHLSEHHLTPGEVGAMASAAGVGEVILTHLSGCDLSHAGRCVEGVRAAYSGPVIQAKDLERFKLGAAAAAP